MSVFDVEHHEGDVLVVVVELLGLVAELGLHLDDAVEGLVGDHGLEADVQLEEGGGVGLVQQHFVKSCSGTRLGDIMEHAPVELESVHAKPSCDQR